jgi:retron-type reverse transcriptase
MSNSSPGQLTRQQLYEQIRQSSKDEVILRDMIRLGFWDENQEKPSLSAELIVRKGELERELQELLQKNRDYSDPEKVLKNFHKQRKKEALRRREETKRNQNDERFQRALGWYQRNQQDIVFLGKGYSAGLSKSFTDRERLVQQGLPQLESAAKLADAMGVSINELRFLSFARTTATISHYQTFLIAKKSGGTRKISAPMPRLKRLQYWILDNILNKIGLHDAAHGFVPKRSIVTNAQPHVGAGFIANMDLKDFFPTITYKRIKGLFCKLGYSEQVATILALLCSEPDVDQVELDDQRFFVARSERHLPQGAPTSPAISNLICRNLDTRLTRLASNLELAYTRYADDLTFSGSRERAAQLKKLLWRTERVIEEEGFSVHPAKTRVMPVGRQQQVTGIVVNEKLSIDRKTLKRFRALLFQIEKDGLEGKEWGKGELIPSIEGYANFVAMVDPEKGIKLQKRVTFIKRQYGYQVRYGRVSALNQKLFRKKSAKGEAPYEGWWSAAIPAPPLQEITAEQHKEKATQQRKQEQQQRTAESDQHLAADQSLPLDNNGNKTLSCSSCLFRLMIGYGIYNLIRLFV